MWKFRNHSFRKMQNLSKKEKLMHKKRKICIMTSSPSSPRGWNQVACISLIANIIPLLTCRKKGARGKWYVVECELLSGHYWRLLLWLVLVGFVEGEEEGVGHALAGDVGAWAVAGDDRN